MSSITGIWTGSAAAFRVIRLTVATTRLSVASNISGIAMRTIPPPVRILSSVIEASAPGPSPETTSSVPPRSISKPITIAFLRRHRLRRETHQKYNY